MGASLISRDEALHIALARAQERGWSLGEGVVVSEIREGWPRRLRKYEVATDPALRGTRARFTIDAETGEIIEEGFMRR